MSPPNRTGREPGPRVGKLSTTRSTPGEGPVVNVNPGLNLKTTSDTRDNQIRVNLEINGTIVDFLVETGASVTMIRPEIYDQLPRDERPMLTEDLTPVTTANGEELTSYGTGEFHLSQDDYGVFHPVSVGNIDTEGILGCDFLQKYGCKIDLENHTVIINWNQATAKRCYQVAVRDTVTIPTGHQMVIAGVVTDPENESHQQEDGHLQPCQQFIERNSVLLANSVVNIGQGWVPLRVMNLDSKPVTLYQGSIAATCEVVDEVVPVSEKTDEKHECDVQGDLEGEIPEHLVDLWERSSCKLTLLQKQELLKFLQKYAGVFATSSTDLGRTGIVKHRIDTGDARPIRQRPRRLPLKQREEEKQQIEDMLKRNVIEPSSSPWASPVVLVKKKDSTWRFCVDYRKVNEVTVKDSYPLPRIDDSSDTLSGSKWFSTLDLQSGYWQVEMVEEDKEKTAFATGIGLFHFHAMPFGLCNSPATFERLMERVLSGLHWQICLVFLDDIIVYAGTFEEELKRLGEVFDRLQMANLKLSPKKCVLFREEVAYLGHIVSKDGIAPDPGKIDAVQRWPQPQNLTAVRSFLGLCSYYRRFIPNFSSIAKCLSQLTEKDKPFIWTTECEKAFQLLKTELTQAPILAYPNPEGQLILDTDASQFGIGAVLSQMQDDQERVLAYYSRTLTKPERRYCVTRKELLAVVQAMKHFHHYLYGTQLLVRTDHNALRWLMDFKNPVGQTARWLEVVGTYRFKIEHRPGKRHGNADGLSRRPCSECNQCDRAERAEEMETREERDKRSPIPVSSLQRNRVMALGEDPRRAQQLADPDIGVILRWMETSPERPSAVHVVPESIAVKHLFVQWEQLEVKQGVLYRRWESSTGDQKYLQYVVPKVQRDSILRQLHDAKTAGHLGIKKTEGRVQERFYWPNFKKDVKIWCMSCDICASRKAPPKTPRAPMQHANVGAPLERIAIDITGPLPESHKGNKYILVICDYFTKWTEAFPIPDQEATTVADILVKDFLCRFGCADTLHSDQGKNFESAVFQETCRLMGIDKTRTTPYHPMSNGLVERFNRTLKDALSKFVDTDQRDWDQILPFLMMAYRSAEHESSGFSPNEMMLGRRVHLPANLMWERPPEEISHVTSEYVRDLEDHMERAHQFARENLARNSLQQKNRYDRRVAGNRYERGDSVWLHNPSKKVGRSPKLQRPWEGPYLVIDRLSAVTYRIQRTSRSKPKVVHFNRLKPYQGSNPPSWNLPELAVILEEGEEQNEEGVGPAETEEPERSEEAENRGEPEDQEGGVQETDPEQAETPEAELDDNTFIPNMEYESTNDSPLEESSSQEEEEEADPVISNHADEEQDCSAVEYEVEEVIKGRRSKNGGMEYLLKWKNFPHSANSWQKEEDLNQTLRDFIATHNPPIPIVQRGRPPKKGINKRNFKA